MPGADVAQGEDLPCRTVEPVDLPGRHAVAAQDASEGLAGVHFALFDAVFVGVDAVEEVAGCFGLLLRSLLRGASAACQRQDDGAQEG